MDSAVGVATGYGLDDRGVGVPVPVGSRIFSSPHRPDGIWSKPSLRIEFSPRLKRPGREAGRTPPTSAEFKNT
jgi:hypothetical protein